MCERKIGVWLIGALGSISATVILGALALQKGLTDSTGMITAQEPFAGLGLAPVETMEFGGCDIRRGSLRESAHEIARETGCIDRGMLNELEPELARIERSICPGTVTNCGEAIDMLAGAPSPCRTSLREEIARATGFLEDFKASGGFRDVVVVNLASTEPPLEMQECHHDLALFEGCLDRNDSGVVRASTIYAYAAIRAGCPYINFTPSSGALFPALVRLAEREGVAVMGNDGKTGETLVKSALAPLFTCRNLDVMSWEGFNILGNMDGRVLDHPQNRQSKIQTKDAVLSKILGYAPHSRVRIDYVPSLHDQKTAWDFIHFRGFLGAKMSLQFVWQGYDSLLAAPLILDLVRWAEFATSRGESGLMPHLACYFKDPLGVDEHRLYEQFRMLVEYANRAAETGAEPPERS
ncbi:MAG: inositol-3-phosphate synthase [Desulfomonile tiedjei]|nr:inositol-3-phosphate synthase [Desulfomonile tiedjei]